MDLIIFSASFAVLAFLVFLPFRFFEPKLAVGAGLVFALYLGLDDLATVLPGLVPAADLVASDQWNWSGKLWSIALAVLAMLMLGLGRADVGLVAPKNIKTSLIAVGLLTLFSFSLGFAFDPGVPTAETVTFQLLMPGVAEELAYRGVAPAVLLGLLQPRSAAHDQPSRTSWNVVMITAITFGAWHGLGYSDGSFSFNALPALLPFIGGIAYGWLRFHCGSVVLPMLAHGLGNTVFLVPSIL